MTSQLEDERARQAADADDDEVVQSGIESGIVRSHCCSAQKLNPIFQPQHQDGGHLANDISFVQKVCDSSSFDFSDVKLLASQPGGQGSLDGSCDPERSFQSVSFEAAPRWSCGVPGLGASIQQVRILGNI